METDVENRLIWLNGKIVNVKEAVISVLAPTAQFGLNVFEGIPAYWNEEKRQLFAFRLDDHYARLMRSLRLLEIECPYTKEELKQALVDVVQANGYREDISIRQTLFVEGNGSWGSSEPVGMFVAPIPRKKTSAEYNKNGLKVCVSSWRRISDTMLPPRVKCGANYINSRMGQREALRNGYDTCIFLNEQGKVSEGPGSCFFMVKAGRLVTPLLTDSVLESITRDTVMRIAREMLHISVEERSIDRTELYVCDEAFLCGSAMEIRPILSMDQYELEHKSMIADLQRVYIDIVRGANTNYMNWNIPIYEAGE